jgi:hypothetical protein
MNERPAVVFDLHDRFKGHLRLERSLFEGRVQYTLHVGSRQLGFEENGKQWANWYSETNYFNAPRGLVPTAGHDHECPDCARYGVDGYRKEQAEA